MNSSLSYPNDHTEVTVLTEVITEIVTSMLLTSTVALPLELSTSAVNNNSTSPSDDDHPDGQRSPEVELQLSPWAFTEPVNTIYLIVAYIMFLGGLGNILVIGSVFIHKKLRVLSNVFVVNLALADLCVVFAVDLFTVLGIHTHGMIFYRRPVLCELLGVICITACSCSLWTIAAIALNRYICICHHVLYIRLFKNKKMALYIIMLWTLSFFIDFPILVGWGRHAFDQRLLYCSFDISASFTYTIYFACLFMVVPFITLTVCYTSILRFSRDVKKRLKRHAKKDMRVKSGIRTTDLRLLKSVSIIWIAFAVFWVPFTAFAFFDNDISWGRNGYVFATALAHSSSSINSIIYAATNKNFREAYARQLKWLFCCCGLFYKGRLFDTVTSGRASFASISKTSSTRRRSTQRKTLVAYGETSKGVVTISVANGEASKRTVTMSVANGEASKGTVIMSVANREVSKGAVTMSVANGETTKNGISNGIGAGHINVAYYDDDKRVSNI